MTIRTSFYAFVICNGHYWPLEGQNGYLHGIFISGGHSCPLESQTWAIELLMDIHVQQSSQASCYIHVTEFSGLSHTWASVAKRILMPAAYLDMHDQTILGLDANSVTSMSKRYSVQPPYREDMQ